MNELSEHFKIDVSKGLARENCVFKGKYYRITVISDVLLRLEYNPEGKFTDFPTIFALNRHFTNPPKFTAKEDERYLNITNDYFILEYEKEKPFEASKLVPDTNLRISLTNSDKVWYYNHPEIRNYKGSTYSFDKDFKLSNGLYSTDGFATINDTMRPVFVSDGSVKKNPSNGLDLYLFVYKNDFDKCLSSYFELTGYPSLPPRYALGIMWNKNEAYTEEELLDLVENFNKSEIPISSILLGDKYREKGKPNYKFDSSKIPDIKETIKKLHDKKVNLGLTLKTYNGININDNSYTRAKEITGSTEEVIPLNVYNTKLLNAFYSEEIDPLMNLDIDFFSMDENNKDYIRDFMLTHFTYTNFIKDKNMRGLVLARNHGIASHRYPVLYSGKTNVSWRVLKYLPFYNLTTANIGLSWWSHDIGGYMGGLEDAELYTRYIQLGLYSPIFRLSSESGNYYKREPWKWDVKTLSIVKDYTRMRHRLIPYIYTEGYKYTKTGTPLIRPLYYKYPEIYNEPLYKNEYFFGSELFVSPITDPKDPIMNRVLHRLFIPEGTWYNFKTGKKFNGGKRYVTFYKDENYPVFARSGAIIPLAVLKEDDLNDTNPPETLEIQIFPGENNSYNLYEDDGKSDYYKEGNYFVTNINYEYKENNYKLTIQPIEGKTGIIPATRNYKIRFRNTKNAEHITVTAGPINKAYTSRTSGPDLIIDVKDVNTNETLNVICSGENIEIDAVRIINEEIDEIISDLQIETELKEKIASIIFSDLEIRKKRIEIRKLKRSGLKSVFVKMFIKLLEYISEI